MELLHGVTSWSNHCIIIAHLFAPPLEIRPKDSLDSFFCNIQLPFFSGVKQEEFPSLVLFFCVTEATSFVPVGPQSTSGPNRLQLDLK